MGGRDVIELCTHCGGGYTNLYIVKIHGTEHPKKGQLCNMIVLLRKKKKKEDQSCPLLNVIAERKETFCHGS